MMGGRKTAFVYAGQGSQKTGMGHDLYEAEPVFRETLNSVDPSGEIRKLMFAGTQEALSQTENTQKCMVAFAVAMTALLRTNGIEPMMVAGLSLGEYSALNAAGVFTPKEAVELAAFRGKKMAEAAGNHPGKMTAVLGLQRESLQEIVNHAQKYGAITVANYNCPGQMVISGAIDAVNRAADAALQAGAKRCIPLAVSGAFHSPLMTSAADALRERFLDTSFPKMQVPVIFNCTAKPLSEGETIPELLEQQVKSSIYFEDTIRYMENCGIDTVIEIGPGKVLSGFIKKTAPGMTAYAVESEDGFRELMGGWREC